MRSGGRSMIVDPWGVVLAQAPDSETFVARRPRPRAPGRDPRAACPSLANRRPHAYAWPHEVHAVVATAPRPAVDKRRMILDAAVRVFAREGFHTCRVSDIADEANVAYGLVYHYFGSKDEVLDTLFLERWNVMLEAIRETDGGSDPAREKLRRDRVVHHRVLPSRPGPDEGDHRRGHARGELVRRAPISARSPRPTTGSRGIVEQAQASGEFSRNVSAEFAAMAFYGAIEQVLTAWIFGLLDEGDGAYDRAKDYVVETICDGLAA